MFNYFLKRLFHAVIVIVGVTFVVFIILQLLGDPVEFMMPPSATLEQMEEYREVMGFNDPVLVQYFRFLTGMLHGDFGQSYYYNEPALGIVLERLPATLELASAAMLVAVLWGVPTGILSAVKRNTKTDAVIRIIALLGQCIPVFWLGLMMIMLFSVKLHWLPTSGRGTILHLIMPAITLGVFTSSTIIRLLRSNMIEILGKDYIGVAKAKGMTKYVVIMKHAFKNALGSVLTIVGLQIAALLGGSIITETVFGWPGVGRLAVQSITARDFMVVETIVTLMAMIFVLINFLVDMSYSLLNPRIKYK